MAWNSTSSLEDLQARVLPFGLEWQRQNGRDLATIRDGIDFLAAMKSRDDFWAALAPRDPADAYPVDAAVLRKLLPVGPLGSDISADDYLRSVGLTEDEVRDVIAGLDEPGFFDSAIRSAFAEERPQAVARALERILDTDREVLATQHYVRRVAGLRGVARAISTMMGIALLLVGTACGPSAPPPSPQPPATTTPTPGPAPAPDPASGNPAAPPAVTAPPPATPDPDPAPPPRPPRRPRGPPSGATTLYKGVSPRRRSAKASAATRPLPA